MADVLPMFFAIGVGLCLTLMLLALWSSLRGLFAHGQEGPRDVAGESSARTALLREKDELLNAIRELRFEHELGKVSDGDFQRLDQRYRTRAREVLRELDEQLAPYRPRARALLEQALSGTAPARAEQTAAASGPQTDVAGASASSDPARRADHAIAAASQPGTSGSPAPGLVCPQCSTRNDQDAEFCKKCGIKLREEAQV